MSELKTLIGSLRYWSNTSVQNQNVTMTRDELILLLDRIQKLQDTLGMYESWMKRQPYGYRKSVWDWLCKDYPYLKEDNSTGA